MSHDKIVYTYTDEAPALATFSLFPLIKFFLAKTDTDIELKDISLAGRILASFPEYLKEEQRQDDDLAYLGNLVKEQHANIIKLPNISASIPQLQAAISELNEQGYAVPLFYPDSEDPKDHGISERYKRIIGSAVNPILREGNSDRRVAHAVKSFAKAHPHSMGEWMSTSLTHVAHMSDGDFYGTETSHTLENDDVLRIELTNSDGSKIILKENLRVKKAEVIDAALLSCDALRAFLTQEKKSAKEQGVLYSIHLKATMMKISDPIMFGHAVETFFAELFNDYGDVLKRIGFRARNGLGSLEACLDNAEPQEKEDILLKIKSTLDDGPLLAMVDSDKGISNLHIPSDVIIDASMPAAIRAGGKMWDKNGEIQDIKAIIPDRSYAVIYDETIKDFKKNGTLDVTKVGNVSNVGLMAQKAEEYGSHDKTFEVEEDGVIKVIDQSNQVLLEHKVGKGDIWRMCQTKDVAIKDWVRLAVLRARTTGSQTIFWLDHQRAHDQSIIKKVNKYLKDHDISGLDVSIMTPSEATKVSLSAIRKGEDVISVTGNVLRDYLTDLFPILELGTSAKMLSIVPLLAGGCLYETGAGGSAPKHVQQFVKENHLRWDSLGEFLALAVSMEDLAEKGKNQKLKILAECMHKANEEFLINNKSPSRKSGQIDNRGSHYYLIKYLVSALAEQNSDSEFAKAFYGIKILLDENEDVIVNELIEVQGKQIDIGGYFHASSDMAAEAMRPSKTLNKIFK
jgi:isocitrate dehydrogenase